MKSEQIQEAKNQVIDACEVETNLNKNLQSIFERFKDGEISSKDFSLYRVEHARRCQLLQIHRDGYLDIISDLEA